MELSDLAPLANGLAGIASLVIALFLYPTVKALRVLIEKHDERLDNHGERLARVESIPAKRIRRRTRA